MFLMFSERDGCDRDCFVVDFRGTLIFNDLDHQGEFVAQNFFFELAGFHYFPLCLFIYIYIQDNYIYICILL